MFAAALLGQDPELLDPRSAELMLASPPAPAAVDPLIQELFDGLALPTASISVVR